VKPTARRESMPATFLTRVADWTIASAMSGSNSRPHSRLGQSVTIRFKEIRQERSFIRRETWKIESP
jgi:hypothetical protein